jgi:hypothetical protein
MKKILYILVALWGMVVVAEAQIAIDMRKQDIVDGVSVENLKMERNGGYIAIDMLWDLSGLDVDENRAVLLTPWLVNDNDSLALQSVGVYGRQRYYFLYVMERACYLVKMKRVIKSRRSLIPLNTTI